MPFIPSAANSYNVPSVVSKTVVIPPDQYSTAQFYYPPQLVGYSQGYCPTRAERLEVPGGPRSSRKLSMSGGGSKVGGSLIKMQNNDNYVDYRYGAPERTTKIIIPAGQDVSQNQYRDIYDDVVIPKYTPVPVGKVFAREMFLTNADRLTTKKSKSRHRRKKSGKGSVSKRSSGEGYKVFGKAGFGTKLPGKRGRGTKLPGKRGRGTKLPGKRGRGKKGGAIFMPADSVMEPTKGTFIPVPY